MALLAQGEREVRSEGGGSHTALGTGHGDDLARPAVRPLSLKLGARRRDRVAHVGQFERLRNEVVHALSDKAAHALRREVLSRGQNGGSASLLNEPAKVAKLPLVVGI